jgi:hypothetical protein
MVHRLATAVEQRLISVIVYGAHGEHLLVVVNELDLETLRLLAEPVRWWLRKRESWPRLFSTELLQASADVYPIELLDIAQHHRVVYGDDPTEGIVIDRSHLRIQCERELREKLMRLREGYIEYRGRAAPQVLRDLLALSYPSFVRIFRGCAYLLEAPLARTDHEVVIATCEWLDLPPAAFVAVERLARGERGDDPEAVFADYYLALLAAEARIDRVIHPEGRAR